MLTTKKVRAFSKCIYGLIINFQQKISKYEALHEVHTLNFLLMMNVATFHVHLWQCRQVKVGR